MRRSGPFRAASDRRFKLLWAGQSASALGSGLAPVALAFAVLDVSRSASNLGLVMAAEAAPIAVLVLIGGATSDRFSRQAVMVSADVVRCLVRAVLAVLLLLSQAKLWQFIVLGALFGTAEAFFGPAAAGLVPSIVDEKELQRANARLAVSATAGAAVGPAFGGIIVVTLGSAVALAFDAATFAVSAGSLCLLGRASAPEAQSGRDSSILDDLSEGWREFRSRKWLWTLTIFATSYLCLVLTPFLVLGPFLASGARDGAGAWGVIVTGFAVGSILGSALAVRWKPTRPLLAACALMAGTALAPALLAAGAPLLVVAIGQSLAGLGVAYFNVVLVTTIQRQVPPQSVSRVVAYDIMASLAFGPLAFILAGPVAANIGSDTTLWFGAGWALISVAAVLALPAVRDLRMPTAPPAPALGGSPPG